jgi:acyl-CoA reductase-like NAD-dependent aldehyde dehydrogenase
MADDDFVDQREIKPSYTFIGTSPGDELLEVARIHRREVKQLLDSAAASETEGREQEARLLRAIAKERQDRAEEFERAARGETKDPVITEILSDQEEGIKNYVPHESKYVAKLTAAEKEALANLAELTEPPPPNPFARAFGWFSRKR